jgi:pilus assembly protein CpaB
VTVRNDQDSTSRTVVSNLQVLSAGTRSEQEKSKSADTAPASVDVVTLLVTPVDAERIALAQAEGQIVLVLRNPLDAEPTTTSGVRIANLFSTPTAAPPVEPVVARPPRPARKPEVVVATVAPPPIAPPKPYTVEAIRAAKRTEEVVRSQGPEGSERATQ